MKDDLISRKAAIEEMLKCGDYYSGNDEAKRGVAQCIGVIHELPAAEPEKHTEERAETHARDCISRQAAIEAMERFNVCGYVEEPWEKLRDALQELPTAEPTLYGYNIKHLAFVATVMEKEGVTAEYAARTFGDMSRASRMLIEELQEKVEKSLSAMQLPSAQPEIIRCKECLMHGVCRFEQGLGLDGYCSQAERRTDENNNE